MDSKVWLLLEWVDEGGPIPSYSVVNVNKLKHCETPLQPGKLISMRKHGNFRQAKILRISQSKRDVQEQKKILKTMEETVYNCIMTVKKTKSLNALKAEQPTRRQSPIPKEVDADNNSGLVEVKQTNLSQSKPKYTSKSENKQTTSKPVLGTHSPLPSSSAQENKKLCLDKGTQTEEKFVVLHPIHLALIEAKVKLIAKGYLYFISYLNSKGLIPRSRLERNKEASCTELNNTDVEFSSSAAKAEKKINPKTLRVRKVSATNNIEVTNDADMVPIGNGNAKVPASLLKAIDWSSHSMATRQLLHAIFPRRVLATHSLTGKPSPAFLDRPAKKMLNPELVEDIVKTVSKKSGVPKNFVRSSITIKCTDEAKLYRNRMKYEETRKRRHHQNDENISPTPSLGESYSDETEVIPIKRTRKSLRS